MRIRFRFYAGIRVVRVCYERNKLKQLETAKEHETAMKTSLSETRGTDRVKDRKLEWIRSSCRCPSNHSGRCLARP